MLELLVMAMMLAGLLFFLGATVGILRFPDFYCRAHAAGKGDTLATVLLLGGLILYLLRDFNVFTLLTALKLSLIVVFILVASPVATHAIIDAGYEARLPYWSKPRPEPGDCDGPDRRRQDRRI